MIYTYAGHCSQSQGWERICRLAEYEQQPDFHCPDCGALLARVYTPFRLHTKAFEAFRSPVDGSIITSQQTLREHNARNNVVQLHEGYDEKGVQALIKKPQGVQSDIPDLKADMAKAVEKLEGGYTPVLAPETELE